MQWTSKGVPVGAAGLQPGKDVSHNGLQHVRRMAQRRHEPARTPHCGEMAAATPRSARRLSFFIALIVVGVVTSVAYLEVRSFEQHIEADLMDSARLGAQSAADAVAQRAAAARPPGHSRYAARPGRRRSGARRDLRHRSRRHRPPARLHEHVDGRARGGAWTSRDEPSPQRRGPRIAPARRSRSRCRCRAVANYAVAVTVGLESLLQTRDPRTARRARVRRPDHRARHAPRPLHRPSAARTAAARHPADHAGDEGRQSARAGRR